MHVAAKGVIDNNIIVRDLVICTSIKRCCVVFVAIFVSKFNYLDSCFAHTRDVAQLLCCN